MYFDTLYSHKLLQILLCSWTRHFTLIQCLLHVHVYPQVHKWVPVNLMLGVTLQWTSIPSRRRVEILLVTSETGISSSLMGHLARLQTINYTQMYLTLIIIIHCMQHDPIWSTVIPFIFSSTNKQNCFRAVSLRIIR